MRSARPVGLALLISAAACGGPETPPLATMADSASYAVGMNMGASLREVRDDIALDQLVQGLRDMAEGRATRISELEAGRVLQAFVTDIQRRHAEGQVARADSNRIAGDAYRAENAKRPGVTTTASGLQYEVLAQGPGARPAASDRVRVHYRGTLIDGKEFDSSYDGAPVTFAVNEVIAGWTEALQLMSVGSKYRLVLSPVLGYGEMGSPPDIGPNATLVFEVELIGIER